MTVPSPRRSLTIPFFSLRLWCLMAIGCGLAVLWWKWWSDASFLAPLHSRTIQAQVPLVWLDTTGLPEIYLWLIPLSCWGLAWGLTRLCPKPQLWSRAVMVAILLALLVRYVLWRVLTTLNFDSPSAAVVSVGFLGLELLVLAGQAWQLNWLLYERPKVDPVSDPHLQSQQSLAPIQTAVYAPKVDILIPTYDEPLNILKRTIVGCQALDYENVEIFLLDDTRRPEVRELAAILGCHYLTRPNNLHAKAGNLNHGLEFCQGELVVVFDADFVPTRNFLTRTVGFFADATVGLLQTYQSFYNHDPVARNLGLTDTLPQEVEIFSRHYQVLRDAVESAICYGSAFVVRRAALEAVGGFDVDTLSEDYLTGVRLNSLGYRVLYLEESLSAGLCADDLAGHIQQRLRWARGSLQSFFVGANPLTISGLNRQQRIAHLEGLVQWFHSPIRLIFLLLPLVANGLGLVPIKATIAAWIFYSLPYYLVTLSSFSWLNGRSRSALMSDVYSVLQCVPITITVFQTLLFPFGRSFQVTPKGRQRWNYRLNGRVAWPLLLLLGASLINLLFCAWALLQPAGTVGPWEQIGLAWGIYNLLVLGLAVMACVDGPQVDGFLWFALKRPLTVDIKTSKDWEMSGQVRLLSEGGAVIDLETPIILPPGTTLELEFGKSHFKLLAQAISHGSEQAGPGHELRVMFEELSLPEYRKLVQLLFCQPGQWCWPKSQGELKTLGQLLKTLVRPAWQRYPQGRLTPVVIDLPPGHDLPRSQLPKETFA